MIEDLDEFINVIEHNHNPNLEEPEEKVQLFIDEYHHP